MNEEIGIPKNFFSVEFPEQIRQAARPSVNKVSFEEILAEAQERVNKYSINDLVDISESEMSNTIDKMDKKNLVALLTETSDLFNKPL